MRFILWVRSKAYAGLDCPFPTQEALEDASKDLAGHISDGELSVYQCDSTPDLHMVAVARSLKVTEQHFDYLEFTDVQVKKAKLQLNRTTGYLDLKEANALHWDLSIRLCEVPVFMEELHRFGKHLARKHFVERILSKELRRIAQTDPRFAGRVPIGHWLLRTHSSSPSSP